MNSSYSIKIYHLTHYKIIYCKYVLLTIEINSLEFNDIIINIFEIKMSTVTSKNELVKWINDTFKVRSQFYSSFKTQPLKIWEQAPHFVKFSNTSTQAPFHPIR